MAVTLGSLLYKVKASNKQFKNKMSENQDSLGDLEDTAEDTGDSVSSSFANAAKSAAKFAAKVTAVATAATGAMLALTNRVADYGDEIDKTSMKMGISTDALQEFRFASEQMGVETSTLERAMLRLNQEMGAGEEATSRHKERMEELGVEAENAEEAFVQTVEALSQYDNEQRQAAAAADIFGRRASRDLIPIIRQGGEEFQQLRQRAHELGIVMDEDAIDSSVEFHDTMHETRETIAALWRTIAVNFMPRFQSWLEWMVANIPKLQDVWWFVGQTFAVVTDRISKQISNLMETMSPVFERFEEFGQELIDIWTDEEMDAVEKAIETIDLTVDFIVDIATGILRWAGRHFDTIDELVDVWENEDAEFFEKVVDSIGLFLDLIFNIASGLLNYQGRKPDTIQDLYEIWKDEDKEFFEKVVDSIGLLMDLIFDVTNVAWEWFQDTVVYDTLRDLAQSVVSFFVGDEEEDTFDELEVGIGEIIFTIGAFSAAITGAKIIGKIVAGIGAKAGLTKIAATSIGVTKAAGLKFGKITAGIATGAWKVFAVTGTIGVGLYKAISGAIAGMTYISEKSASLLISFTKIPIVIGAKAFSIAVSGAVIAKGIGSAIAGALGAAGLVAAKYVGVGALGMKFSLPIAILGVLSLVWEDDDVDIDAPVEELEEEIENLKGAFERGVLTEKDVEEIIGQWGEIYELTVDQMNELYNEIVGNSIIPEMVQGIYQEFVWLKKMLVGNSIIPDTSDAITEEFKKLGDETVAESKSMTEIIRILWEEMLARMAERTEKDLDHIKEDFQDFDIDEFEVDDDLERTGRIFETVKSTITRGLTDLITDFHNFEDILLRIGDRLAELAIREFIVEPAIGAVAGAIQTAHTGGLIANRGVVRDIPSYHSGGRINPDERVVKVQTGERILSREENQQYESGQTGQPIIINATDAQSFVDRLHENGHAIVDEVSRDMINNGTLRQLVKELT